MSETADQIQKALASQKSVLAFVNRLEALGRMDYYAACMITREEIPHVLAALRVITATQDAAK